MYLLLTWLAILAVTIWLPNLVRNAKLTKSIDADMQRMIRAVLISFLIVSGVVYICLFTAAYIGGFQFWLRG